MERPPAGARLILDFVRRAAAGVEMSEKEYALGERIPRYGIALWLTRFHGDKMSRDFLRHALQAIDMFQKIYPKEAVEISKEVGWPDEDNSSDDSGHVGVGSIHVAET